MSVKGQQVTKIVPGSQADTAGVQLGWLVLKVAGKVMPEDGTKAITAALAEGKKAGKKYQIIFRNPEAVGAAAENITAASNPAAAAEHPTAGADAEAAAAEEQAAAAAAAAEAARLEEERILNGTGSITLKYSTYTETFDIKDSALLAAEVLA